jgi:hypothetical protein
MALLLRFRRHKCVHAELPLAVGRRAAILLLVHEQVLESLRI